MHRYAKPYGCALSTLEIKKSGNNILMSQIVDCRDCGREVQVTLSDDSEIIGKIEVVCGICAYRDDIENED
jgi:hypothetical protein